MVSITFTCRLVVVACLLASLGTAGLSPCLLAATMCRQAADDGAKVCCCQGKCAAGCKMACCSAPEPKQDRAPAPAKLSNELSPLWGLAASPATTASATASAELGRGNSCPGAWCDTPPSLLALSVRLNV